MNDLSLTHSLSLTLTHSLSLSLTHSLLHSLTLSLSHTQTLSLSLQDEERVKLTEAKAVLTQMEIEYQMNLHAQEGGDQPIPEGNKYRYIYLIKIFSVTYILLKYLFRYIY